MRRFWLVSCLALGLGACDPASQGILVGANIVSLVHTEKTLTDHLASSMEDQDCSILHWVDKKPYCQPRSDQATVAGGPIEGGAQQARSYCYRTLGEISCYRMPDDTASSFARVY